MLSGNKHSTTSGNKSGHAKTYSVERQRHPSAIGSKENMTHCCALNQHQQCLAATCLRLHTYDKQEKVPQLPARHRRDAGTMAYSTTTHAAAVVRVSRVAHILNTAHNIVRAARLRGPEKLPQPQLPLNTESQPKPTRPCKRCKGALFNVNNTARNSMRPRKTHTSTRSRRLLPQEVVCCRHQRPTWCVASSTIL